MGAERGGEEKGQEFGQKSGLMDRTCLPGWWPSHSQGERRINYAQHIQKGVAVDGVYLQKRKKKFNNKWLFFSPGPVLLYTGVHRHIYHLSLCFSVHIVARPLAGRERVQNNMMGYILCEAPTDPTIYPAKCAHVYRRFRPVKRWTTGNCSSMCSW